MSNTCPHCGKSIICDVVISKAGKPSGFIGSTRQTFKHSLPGATATAPALFDGYDYEKRQPAREPNVHADVAVPALQSVITGVLSGGITSALMSWLAYDSQTAIATGGAAAMLTTAGMWLLRMDTHQKLLWLVEVVTGRDIDGDQEIGKPEPVDPVRLEVVTEPTPGKFAGLNIDLPDGVDRVLFAHWASMVVNNGMSTGREHWTGKGRPFGRPLYDKFLTALEAAGIIHDYGDGRGRVLTNGGRHSLQRFLRTAK